MPELAVAEYRLTGMFTSPKLMAPFHIVRVDVGAWPASSDLRNSVLGCLIYCEARYSRTLSAE